MTHPVTVPFKFFGAWIMPAGFQGIMIKHTRVPGPQPMAGEIPGFVCNIETITGGTDKCANAATNTF